MAKYYKLEIKIQGVIVLFLISLVTFAQTNSSWRLATWSDETAHYYDPSRITRPKPNIIRVWIRIDKNWKSNQIEKSIELTEFHCSERKIRKLQSTKYDSNDKVLSSISSESAAWNFVIPETVGEGLLEIFCFGKEDAESLLDAQEYYDEAEKMAQNNRFTEAAELYKKAIAIRPKDVLSHLGLSKALSELKQYELAVFHANKAIEFYPPDYVYIAYYNLGEIYEKQKKYDLAIQTHKRGLKSNPEKTLSEWKIEYLYEKSNRNLELIAFYEERLQVRPNDVNLLLKLGDLQKKINKIQNANITYNKALKAANSNITSSNVESKNYNQLADVYAKLGQTDNQIETYKQGLKNFPDDVWLRSGLANSLSALGKFNEAIEQYEIAIDNSKDKKKVAWLYSLLARSQYKAGQSTNAIESMKIAVSLDADVYNLTSLAEFYKKNGNLELAYKTINEALVKKPIANSYRVIAEIYEAQGQIEKAKTSYQEAIKLCPKCAWVYNSFGEFFIRQNDKISSMKQYQILKSLDAKAATELLKKINSMKP